MKKQIAAAVAALALIPAFTLPATALADSVDMRVEYSVKSSYTLRIPANIILSENQSRNSGSIGVNAANIEPGKVLNVSIKNGLTDHKATLTNKSDETVKAVSTVTDSTGKPMSNGDVVSSFEGVVASQGDIGNELTFSKLTDAKGRAKVQAGSYLGVMTFETAIVDKQ